MGKLIIPASGNIYIDTNIVIYTVEKIAPYHQLLDPLWQDVVNQGIGLITSELTWLETLTKPLRDKNTQLENLFRAFLTANEITMIPTNRAIWERAAHIRSFGLKTPDAIHAATALDTKCDLFLTNDPIFQRIAGLSVVVLSGLLNP